MSSARLAGPLAALLVLLASAPGLSAQSQIPLAGPTVRVRLFAASLPTTVTVGAADAPSDVVADGMPAGRLAQGAALAVSVQGSRVRAVGGGLDLLATQVEVEGATEIVSGRLRRVYSGRLAVRASGGRLQIVNHVPMPDYVASVVASEYPFREIEGVKAQAVLARTYAARRLRTQAESEYDLDDHQGSQVYGGRGASTDVSRRATEETQGEVLTYGGELAEAVYSSSSGGHTANNEAIWKSAPVPYLRGVPDPYDVAAPDHRWRTTAPRERVLYALSRRFGGRVADFHVLSRDVDGRVLDVRLSGAGRSTISGTEFRDAVNAVVGWRTVRSTNFSASGRGSEIAFEGRGFGHGVGMSQYGARGQAQAGRSYRDILDFYFGGTSVDPFFGTGAVGGIAQREGTVAPSRWRPTPRSEGARRWPTPRREAPSAADPVHATATRPAISRAPSASAGIPTTPDASMDPAERPVRRTAW